jgi:hypothetical protein
MILQRFFFMCSNGLIAFQKGHMLAKGADDC